MKINEEINALTKMGLDPLRFLVAPRVLAGILVTPVLTIYSDLWGWQVVSLSWWEGDIRS